MEKTVVDFIVTKTSNGYSASFEGDIESIEDYIYLRDCMRKVEESLDNRLQTLTDIYPIVFSDKKGDDVLN